MLRNRACKKPKIKKSLNLELWNAAANSNDLSVITRLLKAGASPTCKPLYVADTDYGYTTKAKCKTALHLAISRKNSEMVSLFLSYGANPIESPDTLYEDKTYFQWAADAHEINILRLLINHAYLIKTKDKHSDKTLAEKARILGDDVFIALAQCIFYFHTEYVAYMNGEAFKMCDIHDIKSFIEDVFAILVEAKNGFNLGKKDKQLCWEIALFLSCDGDDYDSNNTAFALAFCVLADDYRGAEFLKLQCYSILARQKTRSEEDDDRVIQPLNKTLNKQELLRVISNTPLLAYLEPYSRSNASFSNELGDIYARLKKNNTSRRHSEQGALLGSDPSVVRLSNLREKMPKRRGKLAKYTAMCYHKGIGGKEQSDIRAVKYLNKAMKADKKNTINYLVHSNMPFVDSILSTPKLLDYLELDFAIALFKKREAKQHCRSSNHIFLLYCAQHDPKHEWVRQNDFVILAMSDKSNIRIRVELAMVFLIINLLNNDAITPQIQKYKESILTWDKDDLAKNIDSFSFFYGYAKNTIKRVSDIILTYRYLLSAKHPSIETMPYKLDSQGAQQLSSLIKGDKNIPNRHKVENILEQIALNEFDKSLASHEEHEERKEKIAAFIAHPQFTQSHGGLFNSGHRKRLQSIEEYKKELDEDNSTGMKLGRIAAS